MPVKICAVGDLMLADQPCCFGFGIRSRYSPDYSPLLPQNLITSTIGNADIRICNLEGTLAAKKDSFTFPTDAMAMDHFALRAIKDWGFNVVNLANNHSLELGGESLLKLKAECTRLGLTPVGAGEPYICHVDDLKIGITGYTCVPDHKNDTSFINIWSDEELTYLEQLSQDVDFLIVNMHWGNEFISSPSQEQISLSERLMKAGVHLILGAHPHVLQPSRRMGNSLTVYSMGNFIFDNYFEPANVSAIFSFTLNKDIPSIEMHLTPITMMPGTYRVQGADPETTARVRQQILAATPSITPQDYGNEVLAIRTKYRLATISHFFRNFFRYKRKVSILKWGFRRLLFVIYNRSSERANPNEVYKWN